MIVNIFFINYLKIIKHKIKWIKKRKISTIGSVSIKIGLIKMNEIIFNFNYKYYVNIIIK
jgi:hypothetical protein